MAKAKKSTKKKSSGKKKAEKRGGCGRFLIFCIVIAVVGILFFNSSVGKELAEKISGGDLLFFEIGKTGEKEPGDDIPESEVNIGRFEDVELSGNDKIRFEFFDVGQGDCTLVTTPGGKRILIDTGLPETAQKLLMELEDRGIREIEYLVLTHPHSDHIGGAAEVLTVYNIRNVIMPAVVGGDITFERTLTRLELEKKDGCRIYRAVPGDVYEVDGCRMEIFGPCGEFDDLNNSSIIMKLCYGEFDALFTGDAEGEAENAVISFGASLDCELYHAGHHGSNTSSTSEFLGLVTPAITIISCDGNNAYGHPHSSALARMRAVGSEYYITADQECITVLSDGEGFRVETEK